MINEVLHFCQDLIHFLLLARLVLNPLEEVFGLLVLTIYLLTLFFVSDKSYLRYNLLQHRLEIS